MPSALVRAADWLRCIESRSVLARVSDSRAFSEREVAWRSLKVKVVASRLKVKLPPSVEMGELLSAGAMGLLIGVVTGLCRLSSNPTLRDLSTVYVELVRGTPLLVQIFIFYFFIGTVLNLSREFAGVAALALFTGAYVAEIVRGGVQSIVKGQAEAARSLGLTAGQAMRCVVLPQAFKRALPALAGQFISLVKDTSLVSVIAITELTKSGREAITTSFSTFEIWFCVAALYLVINLPLSQIASRLERRLAQSD